MIILPCSIEKISQIKHLLFIKNWKLKIGNSRQKRLGFTLIELLVVTAILGILTSVGVASYNNFNDKRVVEKAAQELKTDLRLAQSKAMNNEKPDSCGNDVLDGWYIEYENSSSYKIYGKCGGKPTEHSLRVINLEKAAFDSDFGIIHFKVLGGTNLADDLSITLLSITLNSIETITISKSGDIY